MGGKTETLEAVRRKNAERHAQQNADLSPSFAVSSPSSAHYDVLKRAARVHAAIKMQSQKVGSSASGMVTPQRAAPTSPGKSPARVGTTPPQSGSQSRKFGLSKLAATTPQKANSAFPDAASAVASVHDQKLADMRDALRVRQQELNHLLGVDGSNLDDVTGQRGKTPRIHHLWLHGQGRKTGATTSRLRKGHRRFGVNCCHSPHWACTKFWFRRRGELTVPAAAGRLAS